MAKMKKTSSQCLMASRGIFLRETKKPSKKRESKHKTCAWAGTTSHHTIRGNACLNSKPLKKTKSVSNKRPSQHRKSSTTKNTITSSKAITISINASPNKLSIRLLTTSSKPSMITKQHSKKSKTIYLHRSLRVSTRLPNVLTWTLRARRLTLMTWFTKMLFKRLLRQIL